MPNPSSAGRPNPDSAAPDKPDSPFERTYRGILRSLYEGTTVPGQRLAAPDLMQQFAVGRGTVREVLQRLASVGIVSMEPHRGAQLRLFTRNETSGLLDLVELFVGLAARGAAKAVGADTSAQAAFQATHDALQEPRSPIELGGFFAARDEYYRLLVRLSGNSELQRSFPTAQVQIMRAQLRRFQNAADSLALSDYTELSAAVLAGDAERAEQAGRQHVNRSRQRIQLLPDSAFSSTGR